MDGIPTPAARSAGLPRRSARPGETVDELVGAASAMRTQVNNHSCPHREHSIDTCGTGGDGAGTVNDLGRSPAVLIAACGGSVPSTATARF